MLANVWPVASGFEVRAGLPNTMRLIQSPPGASLLCTRSNITPALNVCADFVQVTLSRMEKT